MNVKVITAIEDYVSQEGEITCFLAGGITNCGEWQDKVIEYLQETEEDLKGLVIFNPRRKNFPINDPNASEEQITWEFNKLEECDIFSMYFVESESVQPICLYELGRNLVRIKEKFPNDYSSRIVVTSEPKYSRLSDVIFQTRLATPNVKVNILGTPEKHANAIINAFKKVKKPNEKFLYTIKRITAKEGE